VRIYLVVVGTFPLEVLRYYQICLDEILMPTYALADLAVGSSNLLGRHFVVGVYD